MGSNAGDAFAECQKIIPDCKRDWFVDEEPSHTVSLDALWIDQTEVTNAMYAKYVAASVCKPSEFPGSYSRTSYYSNPEFADYPMIFVNWDRAHSYCSWAGRRLSDEAGWKKPRVARMGVFSPGAIPSVVMKPIILKVKITAPAIRQKPAVMKQAKVSTRYTTWQAMFGGG